MKLVHGSCRTILGPSFGQSWWGGCHRGLVGGRRHDVARISCAVRGLLTPAVEPSLDDNVVERPCTLVLAQDIGVVHGVRSISDGSWHDDFTATIPRSHGISYRQWTLSERRTLESSFDGALTELKEDLGTLQNAVLVARGPWTSWMAQFYLESLPLAGLVMVDPLPFDDEDACFCFQRQYKQHYYPGNDRPTPDFTLSREYALFQDYINHFDHWALRLERGIIPMLVLATSNVVWEQENSQKMLAWQLEYSKKTAARHSVPTGSSSRTSLGNVPVIQIDSSNREECAQTICSWIEKDVL
jgi:hypothetical protein